MAVSLVLSGSRSAKRIIKLFLYAIDMGILGIIASIIYNKIVISVNPEISLHFDGRRKKSGSALTFALKKGTHEFSVYNTARKYLSNSEAVYKCFEARYGVVISQLTSGPRIRDMDNKTFSDSSLAVNGDETIRITRDGVGEEERTRMLFSKLKQVLSQKFGYGVKENKAAAMLIYKMCAKDLSRVIRYGALYHIKRIYRGFFTFRVETVIVSVQEGDLKGRKVISVLGKPYYSFQGIPYAKPPIGPLRFKDPVPPEPWKGVRSALKEGSICTQVDLITGLTRGSEDCLYLNIFTPEIPREGVHTEGKAVLVWIHGGGFHVGSGNAEIYGPDFLIQEDIILITLNYRLGVLGFLSTGTEDAPGNAGLKDLVQALRWIEQNIAAFGGDPKKVTIFGESAGAAAVHFLMLSPMAKGLFRAAISQSGSSLCPWTTNNEPLEAAFKLGRAFGLETNDPKVLVDYLRKISPKVLAKKHNIAVPEINKRLCIPFAFLPCIEPASYPNAFLTEDPLKLLESKIIANDVPYITGVNEMEGMIFLKMIIDKVPPAKEIDQDFERLVPKFLNLPYGSAESKAVAQKIREFYFSNQPFDKHTHKEYIDLNTDTYFMIPANTAAKLQSRFMKSPIYNYQFLYEGNLGLLKKILNAKNISGPVHADELGYLFHIPILGPNIDPKTTEMKVSRKMVRLWANFAKYGNPTPDPDDPILGGLKWKPFTEENSNYLVMNENFFMSQNMNKKRVQFWKDLGINDFV